MRNSKMFWQMIRMSLILFFIAGCTVPPPISPTDTQIPPTDTPIPPTETRVQPTNTFLPPTDAPVPPTATLPLSTSTPDLPTSLATLPPQPTITDADREKYALLQACERIIIVLDDQVLVPHLSGCYHELYISTINGNMLGVAPGAGGDMAFLSNGLLAAMYREIRFASYSLTGKTVNGNIGSDGDIGEILISVDSSNSNSYVVIVKLASSGVWSGYVDLTKPGFDLKKPIDQQEQSPLQEGNQFE
jgi:hypothetical protein